MQGNPAGLAPKYAVTTLVAGLALLVPAAIGLHDNGPTIIHPLPALTILPAFFLAGFHLWRAAVVIPTLLFFAWNPGLLFGDGKIPRKSTKAAKTASLPLGFASDPPSVLENLNGP